MADINELSQRIKESAAKYLAEQGLQGPDLGEVGLAAIQIYSMGLACCAAEDFGRAVHGKDSYVNPTLFRIALNQALRERAKGLIERN